MAGRELTPTHILAAVAVAELVRQVAMQLQAQLQTQWVALDLSQQLVAHRLHTQVAAAVAHRVHLPLVLVVLVAVALVDITHLEFLEQQTQEAVVVGLVACLLAVVQAAQAAPVSSLFNTPLPHQPKQSAFSHSQAVPYGYALLV
jgi:nitrogen fixation/metabolism regulation signal transduction histidine kinase